jgi:hypothetical protein
MADRITKLSDNEDNMRFIQFSVEQHHIDKGIRHNNESCPVGLAIKDGLPNDVKELYVSVSELIIFKGYEEKIYASFFAPSVVREFVYAFDNGLKVTPFKFWIPVPDRRHAIIQALNYFYEFGLFLLGVRR